MPCKWRSPFRIGLVREQHADRDLSELLIDAAIEFEDILNGPLDIALMLERMDEVRHRIELRAMGRGDRNKLAQLYLSYRRRALTKEKKKEDGAKEREKTGQRDGEILSLLES